MTPRTAFFRVCPPLLLLGIVFVTGLARSSAADAPKWLTGERLRNQLDQKVSVTWSGVPLRQALKSLSQSQHVAIMLDRRIDPEQKIELTLDDLSLDAALKSIVQKMKIGVGQVGSVFYFGPESTARRVRTLAALRRDEVLRLPIGERSKFLSQHPWHWDDGAAPADLMAGLATECKTPIGGLEKIPADLWPAADLPAMNFIERLTLIAAQFDRTFEIAADGTSIKLTAMPESAEISHSYTLPNGVGPRQVIAKLKTALPDAQCDFADGKLQVRGRAEEQDFVADVLAGRTAKNTTVTPGKKVYSLSLVKPVGDFIKALGEKLGLEVKFDAAAIEAAGISLKKEVRVNVKEVSEEELLQAVLTPAGLTFDRQGKTITVRPAKK